MPNHAAFIQSTVQPAQASQAETMVLASVTIAQAILESDWGESHLAHVANNYFGIKASRNSDGSVYYGHIAIGYVEEPTKEVINGQSVTVKALFRKYRGTADSFRDHGHFLRDNPRYASAFQHTHDPNEFVRQLQHDGYATDPQYASKLIHLMQTYNLYQYDREGNSSPPRH